jgi:two-component system, NarL family, nitrate/nitrite response regulator NarL
MTQRDAVLDLMERPAEFEVALLVRDECVRQGLTAMLSSLVIVRGVTIWNDIGANLDFDIFILRFGDVSVAAADLLAQDARRRGKKILLLLNGVQEDMLDAIAAIPCNGFLVQDELTSASLAATVARVTAGDAPMPAMLANRLANRLLTRARGGGPRAPTPRTPTPRTPTPRAPALSPGAHLTPRERQVLDLLVEGLSNKQIARRLYISQHGVKRLVSNVLAKLNCPNRTQAVAVALTAGIVPWASGHPASLGPR